MTIDEIKQLIQLVQESSIAELEISRGDDQIKIIREHKQDLVVSPQAAAPTFAVPPAAPVAPAAAPAGSATPAAPQEAPKSNLHEITSPMVGTFYRAPSPDSDPYVEVGDKVEEGQVVCIVEAMKLMNEISADRAGVVEEIAVENAQPVEFGQAMFRIKPT